MHTLPHFLYIKLFPVDVIALLHCTRSSLGICASSSGALAGLVLWKVALYVDNKTLATLFLFLFRKLAVNQLIVRLAQAALIK